MEKANYGKQASCETKPSLNIDKCFTIVGFCTRNIGVLSQKSELADEV